MAYNEIYSWAPAGMILSSCGTCNILVPCKPSNLIPTVFTLPYGEVLLLLDCHVEKIVLKSIDLASRYQQEYHRIHQSTESLKQSMQWLMTHSMTSKLQRSHPFSTCVLHLRSRFCLNLCILWLLCIASDLITVLPVIEGRELRINRNWADL